jgi:hypothetical protein
MVEVQMWDLVGWGGNQNADPAYLSEYANTFSEPPNLEIYSPDRRRHVLRSTLLLIHQVSRRFS